LSALHSPGEQLTLSCRDATLIVRDQSNVVRIVPPGGQAKLRAGDSVSFAASQSLERGIDGGLSGAVLDQSRRYRYVLWRVWDPAKRSVAFVMLNPSNADEARNDPTVHRCVKFAAAWGYGGLRIVNLFACRSSDPAEIDRIDNPEGDPENLGWVLEECGRAALVICAWGAHGDKRERAARVIRELKNANIALGCLGTTKNGAPTHPLARGRARIPEGTLPIPYVVAQ
jgi:hypothetical protein